MPAYWVKNYCFLFATSIGLDVRSARFYRKMCQIQRVTHKSCSFPRPKWILSRTPRALPCVRSLRPGQAGLDIPVLFAGARLGWFTGKERTTTICGDFRTTIIYIRLKLKSPIPSTPSEEMTVLETSYDSSWARPISPSRCVQVALHRCRH